MFYEYWDRDLRKNGKEDEKDKFGRGMEFRGEETEDGLRVGNGRRRRPSETRFVR